MKTLDLKVKFRNTDLDISYNFDDNFKNYFIRQAGLKGIRLSELEISKAMSDRTTGTLDFIIDNVNLPNDPVIIDIGSGNSLTDLALSKFLPNAKFILVDGDGDNVNKNLHTDKFLTYNSWQMVRDAIRLSNIDSSRFSMHNIDYPFDQQVDMIISTNSWGLHYPIDVYLDKVVNALKPGGYLVIQPVININGYIEQVNKVLNSIVVKEQFNWMQESLEWSTWRQYFPNVADNQALMHKCVWQKPL